MKKFLSSLVLLAMLAVIPANAQLLKFGVKGGLNVSSMSISEDVIKSENRAGWFIGPSLKLSLPVLPVGVDIAAFYDQKETGINDEVIKQQSVIIPVNLRGNFGLGSLAAVYIAAGPQFGFNVGDDTFSWNVAKMSENVPNTFQLKKSSLSLNLGAGVTVLKHLEIGFAYNLPLGNTSDASVLSVASDVAGEAWKTITGSDAKTNTWSISAAYYF